MTEPKKPTKYGYPDNTPSMTGFDSACDQYEAHLKHLVGKIKGLKRTPIEFADGTFDLIKYNDALEILSEFDNQSSKEFDN